MEWQSHFPCLFHLNRILNRITTGISVCFNHVKKQQDSEKALPGMASSRISHLVWSLIESFMTCSALYIRSNALYHTVLERVTFKGLQHLACWNGNVSASLFLLKQVRCGKQIDNTEHLQKQTCISTPSARFMAEHLSTICRVAS